MIEENYTITYVNGILTVTPGSSGNGSSLFRNDVYLSTRAAALQPAGLRNPLAPLSGLLYTIILPGVNLNSLTGIGGALLPPISIINPDGSSLSTGAAAAGKSQ